MVPRVQIAEPHCQRSARPGEGRGRSRIHFRAPCWGGRSGLGSCLEGRFTSVCRAPQGRRWCGVRGRTIKLWAVECGQWKGLVVHVDSGLTDGQRRQRPRQGETLSPRTSCDDHHHGPSSPVSGDAISGHIWTHVRAIETASRHKSIVADSWRPRLVASCFVTVSRGGHPPTAPPSPLTIPVRGGGDPIIEIGGCSINHAY